MLWDGRLGKEVSHSREVGVKRFWLVWRTGITNTLGILPFCKELIE
jgi:hypothetical protein